ncbi:MAG: PEP/pyruvate-binding domain-containing protein [Thermoanaerobaculales bacterium]|nr:PEP/pyruvate-binding domain-containing protein [Thermoanaerobaculales bacterium]
MTQLLHPAWRQHFQDLKERRPDLAEKVCRKLLVDMQRQGLVDFDDLDDEVTDALHLSGERRRSDPNRPKPKMSREARRTLYELAIKYAERYLEPEEILGAILLTEKRQLAFDVSRLAEDSETPFVELGKKIREFLEFAPGEAAAPQASVIGTRAALVRRLLTDQLPFIAVAKKYIRVREFNYLLDHLVPTEGNQGRIGGKAAGLLLARSILEHATRHGRFDSEFKIPESYFVPSNGILEFIEYNHLEEVINVKYQELDEVREEFPLVERLFKSGAFPPILHKGLEEMLWKIGEKPLVIRSSSLLEDRIGHAFSGKYKSLFIPNRGTIERRLAELEDAISEVYASIFHPDPIEYRKERGLLDFQEQMGILVQVVVGKEMEGLLMPAFAGVAFSRCEMRWSPRINRTDGMARLVVGLGTRAVDRTGNDWPVMVALDQPHLRVLQQPEEVYQYSQHEVDVVDLKNGQFESVELETFLKRLGRSFPMINKIFSIYRHRQLVPIMGLMRQSEDQLVVTFDGLLKSSFPRQLKQILDFLEEGLEEPVDIEFAHDGEDFYLLQCRALSLASSANHIPIPNNIPDADKIFSATRFVQMAQARNLEWIVVIDPRDYEQLPSKEAMQRVAKAVGAINQTLPPKKFILIGPGRWGSRGDIRLGVPVTYADICHTAMLLEVARKKGAYVPDVSFGTHFFQDLVEAEITYLPLYPDEEGAIWKEDFLNNSPNALAEIAPRYADLEGVVKLIDVRKVSDGQFLHVIMDGEADRGLAFLAPEHI